jgi:DNA-binding NtrC family response regulator
MITDNDMPKLTGIELIKKVRATRLALPVIMATGKFPLDEFTRHPQLQPAVTLLKPYTFDELVGAVQIVLLTTAGADGESSSLSKRPTQPSAIALRL